MRKFYVGTLLKGSFKEEDISSISRLLNQLSKPTKKINRKILRDVLTQQNLLIVVARGEISDSIIGMGTAYFQRTLSGGLARIEDVVVDKKYRGMGIGKTIVKRLLKEARIRKDRVRVVELTSGPHRKEANFLYKRLFFKKIETNVYRKYVK